jgi:tRNA(Ile)-lysidine synthase
MVLLHLLHGLSKTCRWRITVAHLDHQLRGRASLADAALVARTAKKLNLPVVTERADVRGFARARKLSLEMAARKLRHGFLARVAARKRIPTVALAHHAGDQLELFFLRLLRGSGGEGLAGMKWRSPSPANPRIELVRPLLELSKTALRQYALAKKIPFREDASNASRQFPRNRIRHELLPLLRRKYQPALDKTILRVMELAGAEAELASALAAAWLKKTRRAPFATLPLAVQRRCLQLQLVAHGVAPDFDLVEQLRLKPGKPVSIGWNETAEVQVSRSARLPAGSVARVCRAVYRGPNGLLRFQKAEPAPKFQSEYIKLDLAAKPRQVVFADTKIRWRVLSKPGFARPKPAFGIESFDADKVGSPVFLRHWQPGDRFQPIGMAHAVKLQDLFTNEKVPRPRRHELLVAATTLGEVFWVEGLRISERFKLAKPTRRRLEWRWTRPKSRVASLGRSW